MTIHGLDSVKCEEYCIVPLQNNSFEDSCLTLSQFANNFTTYQTSNTTLIFIEGRHTLDNEITVSNAVEFSMSMNMLYYSEQPIIDCSEHARFIFSNLSHVYISGLTLIGCDNNIVESVNQLIITRSRIIGKGNNSRGLMIMKSVVNMSNTFLVSNVIGRNYNDSKCSPITPKFNGKRCGGALKVVHSTLTIERCHFERNTAVIGGAIFSESGSNITITDSMFAMNRAIGCNSQVCSRYGGTIVLNSGTMNIHNSSFHNNTSDGNGGMAAVFNAIFLLSQSDVYNNSAGESGGVIASIAKSSIVLEKTNFTFNSAKTGGVLSSEQNTSIIIESSLMLHNTATGNGGVIHATAFSKVTINDTIISNSTAAGFGGVLYTEMKTLVTIKNSIVRNTRGNRAGGVVFAINYTTVSVKSSDFINNWGRTSGGVLHLSHNSTAEFDQSFFIKNRARYGGGVFSIHNSGTLAVVKGSSFTSNYITEHGGVAYLKNGGSIHVIDSIFDKNSAGRGGGVIYGFRKTSINISRSIFSGNKAIMGGGVATIMLGSTLIIRECNFHDNVDSDLGAVIHAVNETTTTIHDSQFSQSLANIGGVFHAIRHNTITIHNTTFSNNTARVNGGTLYARTRCSITIVNCYFINNSAILDGVIVISDNSNITIMGSSFRSNTAGHDGGVIYAYNNGILVINDSYFSLNSAGNSGGAVYGLKNSKIIISNSQVHKNMAQHSGGAFHTQQDSGLIIQTSNLTSNVADYGGVLRAYVWSSIQVTGSVFAANRARVSGGAMAAFESSNITVEGSVFTMNIATFGGVSVIFQNNYPRLQGNRLPIKFSKEMRQFERSAISVTDSSFFCNKADNGGVLYIRAGKAVIESSSFDYNSVKYDGGSIFAYGESSVDIAGSNNFSDNIAERHGGVMALIGESVVKIRDSGFVRNRAHDDGGTLSLQEATASMYGSIVESASAGRYGGVIHVADGTVQIDDSLFINNTATYRGGVMATTNSKLFISSSNFSQNTASNSGGVIYLFSYSKSTIINSIFLQNEARNTGGAISLSLSSDLQITTSALIDNVAQLGGAVSIKNSIISFQFATIGSIQINESKKGEYYSMVSSNEAAISGGGVYLENSHLFLGMDTEISNNQASMFGGGVHAINSSIAVETITIIYNNSGTYGGGISMENSKFYGTTESNEDVAFIINFISNQAKYGGAVYVNDQNQECVCSSDPTMVSYSTCSGCFFENVMNGLIVNFNSNIANCSGSDLYGGLLDRCGVVNQSDFSILQPAGVMKLKEISNITNFETISSKSVRVCLCQSSEPDCSQQNYSIDIKNKNGFVVPVAAVDQVQHMVAATILSKFHDLKVSESQTLQRINANCSNLEYQVSFPRVKETYELVIHAQGPCNNQGISTLNVTIYVDECSCPPGFMPADRNTKCDCICDRRFETFTKYIQECNAVKGTVIRTGIFWITYLGTMHDDNVSPYFIHPYCPLDYCQPPNLRIPIHLNLSNGSDAQCEKNRGGMLCGDCLPGYSLSLGSSECIKCPEHWYGHLVGIIIAAFFAGIMLVFLLLWLNLTIAVGTLNSIIFYANIINANRITYFGQSRFFLLPSFLSWLNLDIGLNVCFFERMDIYAKTWIQVAFPAYMIFLVIMIILLSRLSSRFSNLIGKRNPVATLATLILLSYTKLLQTVITTFSFVKIKYPNGTTDLLWLPNANMAYADHKLKLTILIILAVVILIFGMLYTVLIFSWQWLLHCPRSKLFKWTRNQKLHSFINTYHTPNTARHRYWTGMLLVVRVIIYLVAAFSSSSELPITVLSTVVLMCSLLLYKTVWTFRVYRNWILNTMESFIYFNIALFALFTLYTFNNSGYRDKATLQTLQIASAYVSVGVTFLLLLCVIIYHIFAYSSSSTKVHSMASCCTKLSQMMTRFNSHMSSSSKLNIVDREFVSSSENVILDVLDSPRIITHTSPFVKFEKASMDTIASPSNDDNQPSKI
jgi:predicted outer membrane repeat protein